jgi:hypothetical protein
MTEIKERSTYMIEQKGISFILALFFTVVALLFVEPLSRGLVEAACTAVTSNDDSDCDRLTDNEENVEFTFPDGITKIAVGGLDPSYKDLVLVLDRAATSYIPIEIGDSQCTGYTGDLCNYDAFEYLSDINMTPHVFDDTNIANPDRTITSNGALAAFLHEDTIDDSSSTLGKTNQTIELDDGNIYPLRIRNFVVRVYEDEAGYSPVDLTNPPAEVQQAIIDLTKEVAAHEVGHEVGCMPEYDSDLGHHLKVGARKIMEAFPKYTVRRGVTWSFSTEYSRTCRNGASLY